MIIYPITLIGVPLSIAIWIVEGYLGLTLLRLILSRVPVFGASAWQASLATVVDAMPGSLSRWVEHRWNTQWDPRWSWAAMIISLLLIRQILLTLIVSGARFPTRSHAPSIATAAVVGVLEGSAP